jgi:hypothetical protein
VQRRQPTRQVLQAQQVVAREHVLAVTVRKRVVHRGRADGDDDRSRTGFLGDAVGDELETHPVRIEECGVRGENIDAVPHQLMPGHVDLVGDDMVHETGGAHGDALLDR